MKRHKNGRTVLLLAKMSDSEEEDMSNYGLSMVSIAGPSKHDCGYCKGKDTSVSFGIWAHSMTCAVSIL